MKDVPALVAAIIMMLSAPGLAAERAGLDLWAQWRGPVGTGVAPLGDPPVRWSETQGVRWKTPIPGRGLSSPVAWGERVFLTTAIPRGEATRPEGG